MKANGYQDFFQKKRQIQRGKPGRGTGGHKKFGAQQLWLMVISICLAAGSVWYLCGGEEKAAVLFNKVEISFFGQAMAETKSGEPPTDETPVKSADGSVTAAKVSPSVKDPAADKKAGVKTWTDEEVALFTQLESRKKQLDTREAELAKLEEELQLQRAELDKRLQALDEVRTKIAAKLDDRVKVDQQKVDSLVSVYANMKPVQAAKVLEGVNEDLAVEVLGKMKNKSAAEILNLMDSDKAKRISERFAGFREPALTP